MIKKTRIMLEIVLRFKGEVDVYALTDIIGLSPTQLKNMSEIKRNSYCEEKTPAFWCFDTGYIQNTQFDEIADAFINHIQPHLVAIKNVLSEQGRSAHFCIVPEIIRKDKPSIYINKNFLDVIHYLDATVDIDMYFYG